MTTVACPGEVIGSVVSHLPGPGTHVYESKIHASIAGPVVTTPPSTKAGKSTVSITQGAAPSSSESLATLPINSVKLPKVGSTILGRVVRVQQRQLNVTILVVDPSVTMLPTNITLYTALTNDELQPQAILRREDIRSYKKDKVVMNEMYRTGDIVRATVISLGDEKSYYISTAGNDFGVVIARSDEGNPMVPISWREMKDAVTGKIETRKVAKPV